MQPRRHARWHRQPREQSIGRRTNRWGPSNNGGVENAVLAIAQETGELRFATDRSGAPRPGESTDTLAARRALGARLARLRTAAGLTQHDLAPLVGYGRSTVGNVEIGKQRVPRRFWLRCDEILATGGGLTEAYDEVEAKEREAAQTEARSHDHASAGRGVPAMPRSPGDVDPDLVLHWTGLLRVMDSSHNLFGPRQIHDAACRESAVIRRYRREALGSVKTGLLAVEAWWAEFASWTADNVGDRHAAVFWLDRALALARQAGNARMTAYVFMRQAQQAADRRDGPRAVGLADTAASTAALTRRDRALCAIRRAQGHALETDRGACAAAIKTAYQLVAQADDTGIDEDPDTIGRHCVLAYVQAHEAYCHLRLGHPADAVHILEEILTKWPANYRQDEGLARAWLALSYAQAKRPAEAALEGSRALALTTTTTWSARTLRALDQLDTRLATSPGPAEVAHFRTAFAVAAAANRMGP